MDSFKELCRTRRSHRKFSPEPVSDQQLKAILSAALMCPTSKGLRKWRFVVTRDPERISGLGGIRPEGSAFISGASAVIAVLGEPASQEMWIEDGAIAAVTMQYMAVDLGLGSCWCQVRGRKSPDEGVSAEETVKLILGIKDEYSVLCLLGIGHPSDVRKPQDESVFKWDQVEWK